MSFPRYLKYKDSGVAWLGEVPEGWSLLPSRRLFRQKRKRAFAADEQLSATQKYGVIPQRLFMEREDQKVVLALSGTEAFKHVDVNDFVISLRSFQGGLERSRYCGCVSTAYTVLDGSRSGNADFWAYLFKSSTYIDTLQSSTDGIREGKTISYDQFGDIPIPVAPIPEQRAIVEFLDRETGKIDALVEEQRWLIELLKEKRQAVISHAVTKGLNPNAPMKDSGVEALGMIPDSWCAKRLGQVAEIVRGGSPRPAGDPRFFGGEYMPWITVGEVTKDRSMFLLETESRLTEEGAQLSRVIETGTLILTNSGATLGVPKILSLTGCANDGIIAFLTLKAEMSKGFLYYFLSSLTENLRERMRQGSGQPNLNTGIVGALTVGIPPLNDQEKICARLQSVSFDFEVLTLKAEQAITLLQERRSALISAAVTGKIDVRNYTRMQTQKSEQAHAPA